MNRAIMAKVFIAALSAALPLSVMAQGSAQTIIDGNVGSNTQGVLSVNQAAGDANLQSNTTAAAINANGLASAQGNVVQTINKGTFGVPDVAVARINGTAFNNASGVIKINQAAGAANAQANSVAIAVGANVDVTTDAVLAQTVSNVAPTTMTANGQHRETTVADTAFRGASGIVQVNQSAGIANATSNTFALRVQLGAQQ